MNLSSAYPGYSYEALVGSTADAETALRIHDEYVARMSGQPYPQFLEVDRSPAAVDPVYRTPVGGRLKFTSRSPLAIPAIVTFDRPQWGQDRRGRTAAQAVRFWVSHRCLRRLDYFPVRGDFVEWRGLRHMVLSSAPPPNAYWGQSGLWLGLIVDTVLAPTGDGAVPESLTPDGRHAPAESGGGGPPRPPAPTPPPVPSVPGWVPGWSTPVPPAPTPPPPAEPYQPPPAPLPPPEDLPLPGPDPGPPPPEERYLVFD